MTQAATNPYLRTKIMTASPEELRLMLYDGCVRFCNQAKTALEQNDFEKVYDNLQRAQKIVMELSTSLNRSISPDLCDKLAALYNYCYRLLVDANMTRDTSKLDEVIKLIGYERETWQMLMEKNASSRGSQPLAAPPNPGAGPTAAQTYGSMAGPQQTAMSSLSRSA